MIPHIHAAAIHAWADGAEIEFFTGIEWRSTVGTPIWDEETLYRVKQPDIVHEFCQVPHPRFACDKPNLRCTFDPHTGELKSAEVIKS